MTLLSLSLAHCAPSSPRLEYSGVTAKGALTALDLSDDAEKRELIISRLEKSRQTGFEWADFWRGFSKAQFEKLSPTQRERVFALAKQDCTEQGFHEFSVFVLRVGTGIQHVVGLDRACARPLKPEIFPLYLAKVDAASAAEKDEQLAGLLVSQHSLLPEADRIHVLESLTPNQWESLLRNLISAGRTSLATQLVEIHQKEFGGLTFLDKLIIPWLGQPDALRKVLEKDNLTDVVRLLTMDASLKERTGGIPSTSWSNAMKQLGTKFGAELHDQPLNNTRLAVALQQLHLMELIPSRALNPPPFGDQLKWFEIALRDLESAVEQSADEDRLMASADTDLYLLWTKLRLGRDWTSKDNETFQRSEAVTPLSLALKKKIELKLISDQAQLHVQLAKYCNWLDSQGLAPRTIAQFDWTQTEQPGCLTIDHDPSNQASVSEELPEVRMAFDAILMTAGQSLNLSTNRFDGSFIDGSPLVKHPDLPAEPTSDEDNAITFPVLLGVRQFDPNVIVGPHTYFFVYHYTWRAARAGSPATAHAADGFSGGNVVIRASNSDSRKPVFTSLGGPGQRGVPRRTGGRSSLSNMDWRELSNHLRLAKSTDNSPAAEPMPLGDPSLRIINRLFENAERSADNSVRIYLDVPTLFAHLSPYQLAKSKLACPGGQADVACWQKIAETAAKSLWGEYERACPMQGDHRVCPDHMVDQVIPRLQSGGFIEDGGEFGPENPNGAKGAAGRLSFEVKP